MSIPDRLMRKYYELCTDMTPGEISTLFAIDDQVFDKAIYLSKSAPEGIHPRLLKVKLARRIVEDFYSKREAEAAEEEFSRIFQRKEAPENVEEKTIPGGSWMLSRVLVHVMLAPSMAEARRLIEQGGVSVDGERASEASSQLDLQPGRSALIKVGKRRFVRVRGE
jgi:tyrosyl-tRNA synthetase